MKTKECFVYVSTNNYNGNNKSHIYEIPCYPDEVSESVSVNWADTTILGRTPIVSYLNTGFRSISFSMDLHREMYHGYQGVYGSVDLSPKIEVLLKALKSAAYPNYTLDGVNPPMVFFKFGDLKMRGIIRSVSFVWKKPIVDKQYSVCSVSISMDELADPHHSEGATISHAYNHNNLSDTATAEWLEFD